MRDLSLIRVEEIYRDSATALLRFKELIPNWRYWLSHHNREGGAKMETKPEAAEGWFGQSVSSTRAVWWDNQYRQWGIKFYSKKPQTSKNLKNSYIIQSIINSKLMCSRPGKRRTVLINSVYTTPLYTVASFWERYWLRHQTPLLPERGLCIINLKLVSLQPRCFRIEHYCIRGWKGHISQNFSYS